MRTRPFFWALFILSCVSVLTLALLVRTDAPVIMQVHLDRPPTALTITTVTLRLADTQGIPMERAHIVSNANMTNMQMGVTEHGVKEIGQGQYAVQYQFSMSGPWAIKFTTQADGFASQQQTLLVQVT